MNKPSGIGNCIAVYDFMREWDDDADEPLWNKPEITYKEKAK